jgi:hypothetical protein
MQSPYKLISTRTRCADGTFWISREAELPRHKPQLSRAEARDQTVPRSDQQRVYTPDTGNDLARFAGGGGARDAPDAVAAWLLNGARFVTAGLNTNFSPERLRENLPR